MGGFAVALDLARELAKAVHGPPATGVFECLLALVFIASGIPKIRHPRLAAMAAVDFGVGQRVLPAIGWALGFGELALGALLLVSYRPAVWLAGLLLWLFAVLILRSLVTGRRFSCFCFGDSDSMISWRTAVRTTAFALLAILAATGVTQAGMAFLGRLLQVTIAASLVGVAVLSVRVVRLLHWNSLTLLALKDVAS